MEEKMVAAIYCRVSTSRQKEEGASLETQREACLALARSRGLEVPDDLAIVEDWPGSAMDRPGLDRLRTLVANRVVEAVIVYSTDRLARNPVHLAIVAEECDKKGAELVFVTEPLDNSLEGQLIQYVKGYSAAIEREKTRERTMRGKREWARQGKIVNGSSLFGYRYIKGEGRREINEEEAEIVRLMFRKVVEEGCGIRRVAEMLNELRPAPKGGYWGIATVHRILTNPAYCGETWAFKYEAVEPETPLSERRRYSKSSYRIRDQEQWIAVPGVTPPIIDRETFDAVHEQMKKNLKNSPRNVKHPYLLRGRLRCGLCGRVYSAMPPAKRNGVRRYRCSRNFAHFIPRCTAKSVRAEVVEKTVWETVEAVLRNPELIISEIQRQQEAGPDAAEEERETLQREIGRVDREGTRLTRLYTLGEVDDDWYRRMAGPLKQEKARLQEMLAETEEKIARQKQASKKLLSLQEGLETLSKNLETFTWEDRRMALEALDIVATVVDGGVRVQGAVPLDVRTSPRSSSCRLRPR